MTEKRFQIALLSQSLLTAGLLIFGITGYAQSVSGGAEAPEKNSSPTDADVEAALKKAEKNATSGWTTVGSISTGVIYRLEKANPLRIAASNGGLAISGNSINQDDGNRNFSDKGAISFASAIRGRISYTGDNFVLAFRPTIFYDALRADGSTERNGVSLTSAAKREIGRGGFADEAWLGYNFTAGAGDAYVRLGNQVVRWGEINLALNNLDIVNPKQASRSMLPGAQPNDIRVGVPMLTSGWSLGEKGWELDGFLQPRFKASTGMPAGTFLSNNDYASVGSQYAVVSTNAALLGNLPDTGLSAPTSGAGSSAATRFGTISPRLADRDSNDAAFGLAVSLPSFGGEQDVRIRLYGAKFTAREGVVSSRTGLASALATNYAASGGYFLEHPADVKIFGASLKMNPLARTELRADFSHRFDQPLQYSETAMTAAGFAPAVVTAACRANPNSAQCSNALSTINSNPVISALGGMTAANAASFFNREISGYTRKDISQLLVSLRIFMPEVFGSSLWVVQPQFGISKIHGFNANSIPLQSGGGNAATASAVNWQLASRIEWASIGAFDTLGLFGLYSHDTRGFAPKPLDAYREGRKRLTFGVEGKFARDWSFRTFYVREYGPIEVAPLSDRDNINLSLSYQF